MCAGTRASLLRKKVRIQALERKGLGHRHTQVVVDHQAGEVGAVDEDDLFVGANALYCGLGCGRVVAGGEEHALLHALEVERADEVANGAFAHRALPAFGLQVDGVEAQRVFVEDAVNAVVGAQLRDLPRVGAVAAVAHGHQELHHQPLEEGGRKLSCQIK